MVTKKKREGKSKSPKKIPKTKVKNKVKKKSLRKISKLKIKRVSIKGKIIKKTKKISEKKAKRGKAKKKIIKKRRIAKKITKIKHSKEIIKKFDKNQVIEKKTNINPLLKKSTNIFERNKTNKKLPRAGTNIPGLDKMIEGGFERNSINLIVGGSGSGKSILAIEFLIQGVKKGETTLYVSFEEKKDEFYSNMEKFGWDLQKLENSGKFIFLEYSPEKVKMTLDEGGGAIETLILRHKISRMVMDSITSFSLLFDDTLSKKQANLGLFDIISKWNITTLLTVQNDPLKGKEEELSAIEFEADSIVLLYFTKIKGKRSRFIEVLKMRGTNHSKETYAFEIKKGGISIGRKSNLKKKG